MLVVLEVHACYGSGRWPPPTTISRNVSEPMKSCARTISFVLWGGLGTHGICILYRNEPFVHNAYAMCTYERCYGIIPGTCGNRLRASTKVNRARARSLASLHTQNWSIGTHHSVHLHFKMSLPPFHSHPRDRCKETAATMAPKTNKQTLNKNEGNSK